MSAVRLAEITKINMDDFPYSGSIALAFSALEPALLVTAACIPLLRPLVSRKNSSVEHSSYADGTITIGGTGAHPAPRMGGFSELEDDDGSTRQLHMKQSKFGNSTAEADGSSFGSSHGADNHYNNMELKAITVKKEWKVVEESVV